MRTSTRAASLTALSAFALLMMACTPAASTSASASASQSSATTPSASESEAAACTPESLQTKTAGTFTVGTDNPAFPPYFSEPEDGEDVPDPWSDGVGNPYNGRGFESAIAYALAEELGFSQDQVEWIAVPFNNSIAPGPKDFDVYLAQVSFTEERTQAVDLSEGYFFSNQALVTTADSPLANATSLEDVAQAKLGAAGNTTSLTYITDKIQPSQEPRVYDDNTGAKSGLEAGQVDGVVFDAATAYYIVNVEMEDGVLVGQLPSDPGEQEHFSFVLDKDSPLTDCVDQALLTMGENGELDSIAAEWLSDIVDLPFISE
ncbi:MAG TPA: ABC transporter substrate-binding protein [Candidatus Limnocylindria bacterium]|jgi:polar amino acid transport system substrate-binding protein|nr:ABC transporter substrate-binding protein [Candidatus Limnocylindria bacterium]